MQLLVNEQYIDPIMHGAMKYINIIVIVIAIALFWSY